MTRRSRREARQGVLAQERTAAHDNRIPVSARAERTARKRRARKKIKTIFAALSLLIVAAIVAGALYYIDLHNRMTITEVPPSLLDTPTPPPTEPFNLVIFGDDARNPDELERADTIILMHVNPIEQRVWSVSIPRDTRVELPGYGPQRINAATAFGGPDMAIQAVEDLTGVDLDYFITINFWGFEEIIDAMDGIYIDVPFAIDDPLADFTPDGRATRIDPGLQNLDGAHALTFVRHRDGYVDGDFGRMGAQQLLIRAMIEQMSDVSLVRIPGIASSFADNIETNFTPFELMQLGNEMRGIDPDNFYSTTLPSEWRAPFVWVDEEAAAEVWRNFGVAPFEVEEDYYDEPATPE